MGTEAGKLHQQGTRVFLSYSRDDMAFVDRLAQALTARGITVYLDRTTIEKGADWWERICQLIGKSDTVVFVLSPAAAQSGVCAREVEYASNLGKRLIPVVCREVDNAALPEAIVSINYVFFTDCDPTDAGITFDAAMEELVKALHTDLAWLQEHTRLGELARHWDAMGRPSDLLLKGEPLRVAVDWVHRWLERDGRQALDESDLIHSYIRAGAKGHYTTGLSGWRHRVIAIPAIVILSLVAVIGMWIIDGVYELKLLQTLGVRENEDFFYLWAKFALTLFVLYVASSVWRRYLIGRHVHFFGTWKAGRYALRTVIYNLLWLSGAFLLLQFVLENQ